jgi:1,4-dihydroxy-2-naphthoate octaprenyltransferase
MNRNRGLSLLSPVLLVALWELAVRMGWLDARFYPAPSRIFGTLSTLVENGSIFRDTGISLLRIGFGFLLGGIPAIVVGLLMGISPAVRALVQPIASAIYPIPKIALFPLIIVALGIGEPSKVFTIAVSVFFLVVLNVAASVLQVDAQYFEVARSFGAKGRDLFFTVALPASLPGIMTSIKLGMGFALTLIVGVEFVGANEGLGYLIWHSYELFAIDRMLAGLVVIALVGWFITLLLDEVEYLVVPWQGRNVRMRAGVEQSRTRVWFRALRPWSYTAAVIPVALGMVIAASEGKFDAWLFLLVVAGSIAIQAGTNLMNDYYDHVKGADQPGKLGMGGAIQRGDLHPRQVFIGGVLAFLVGIGIGLYLVWVSGPFILWLGLLSVAAGFFYTAGPFALAYVGLGEVAVFIFMGPVMVVGSYYVQSGTVTWPVVLASLPVGFLVAAILHANNLRDLDTDRQLGKRTLATLLGRQGANAEYYFLVVGTYVSLLVLILLGIAPWLTAITALTLPLAVKLMRIVANNTEAGALHPVLQQTALLHMRFGGLLIVGWIVAMLVGLMGWRVF